MSEKDSVVEDIPFTKKMRKATRDIHNISDALINAKLGFALSDSGVWAEGLLVFYDIFATLESALDRMSPSSLVGQLDIPGMRRRDAFEADLTFYLGDEWLQSHVPRPEVQRYMDHLQQLEKENPHLLMAYIYHLYMGMLSGGQVLRQKRQITGKLWWGGNGDSCDAGNAVTDFGGHKIKDLKKQMTSAMNDAADHMDDVTKDQLIQESKEVFVRNNEIVSTVRGANQVIVKKLIYLAVILFAIFMMYSLLFR